MTEYILSVEGLTKRYGDKTVVNGISFHVRAGEIFGILGPNGAGKTTTLEMIETLRPIDSGKVIIDSIDVMRYPQRIRQIIGVQMQTTAFYTRVTLKEQLQLLASFYGHRVNVEKLLADVQLSDKATSYPETLSGGQKQRLSIVSALVNNPRVLFLDEPTTGLDPQARRHLWELIRGIQARGITVILTTHYMEEAEILCDRVAVMDGGNIIALDTPQKLVDNLLATGFQKPVEVRQANLEDVFIHLTGKALRG